jgi:hypothetical protein
MYDEYKIIDLESGAARHVIKSVFQLKSDEIFLCTQIQMKLSFRCDEHVSPLKKTNVLLSGG